MKVVFLSPSWPREMRDYTRGLAAVGATVIGVGSDAPASLPADLRQHLADYLQVNLFDEDAALKQIATWVTRRHGAVDRVEGIWEPVVLLAARLREALGVQGMRVDTVRGFRDKQIMKERIAAAGLRVPRSARVRTAAEATAAAERIGFPLILKPIDGAGSADTYKVRDAAELRSTLAAMGHVREASCEEFVDGEEFTYDTLCIGGRPVFENVAQYLPRPLVARTEHWVSPMIVTVRDLAQPALADGIALGRGVLDALGMGTGFTHMEWYRKDDGEVVFGEIGCRPGGAHLVDQMNFTCDTDLFVEWARAVCWGAFQGKTERNYNVAIVFKRAHGEGRITAIHGLEQFKQRYSPWICTEELLRPGTPRRNWKSTLLSDGFVIVRHQDWRTALHIGRAVQEEVHLVAG